MLRKFHLTCCLIDSNGKQLGEIREYIEFEFGMIQMLERLTHCPIPSGKLEEVTSDYWKFDCSYGNKSLTHNYRVTIEDISRDKIQPEGIAKLSQPTFK